MLEEINEVAGHVVLSGLHWLALALFVLLYGATEIGFRLACRHARRNAADEKAMSSTSTLVGGMLGLVAFMLGLTINFAQNRYEARRQEVLIEANTIGTAWLRAKLVGGEEGDGVAALIEEYTRVRLAYTSAKLEVSTAPMLARTNALQSEMWRMTTTAARRTPTPVAASLIASLNDMFDASLSQRFAFESRVPLSLTWTLLAGSVLSLGALGYQFGLAARRQMAMTALLVAMWVGAMVLIIDFNQPRFGSLKVDTAPLEWTLQGFHSSPPP
jgi:uncharacterized membrane protein